MAPLYYRGALAAILVYDITNMESFNDVKIWLEEVRQNMAPSLIIVVVGAKVDLAPTLRTVDLDYARRSVAEWVTHDPSDMSSTPASRETSPSRPRTISTMSTRASLPTITTTRPDLPTPSLSSRVRGMSISTPISGSSASSISDISALTSVPPSEGMVRSGSMLGISLGLGKSSSRGRKDPEEERRAQEELERERVDKMIRDCGVSVCEVSGKDDIGIEDLILDITQRLVERKVQIETDRVLRTRDSFMLHDPESPTVASSGICC
ncbi:hypothetical protein RQP46_000608 [Phenoliferia psychrophenolica]